MIEVKSENELLRPKKTPYNNYYCSYNGFAFRKDRTGNTADYYRCIWARKVGCKMRLAVYHDDRKKPKELGKKIHQGHAFNPFELEEMYRKQALREACDHFANSRARQIKTASELLDRRSALGSNEASIVRFINRRKAANCEQHCPPERTDLIIDDKYTVTYDNEPFLLFDSNWEGRDPIDRVLIFGTITNLRNLAISLNWASDGTFDICPKIFEQFYTVHCDSGKLSIPMVYILLARKNGETYRYTIEKLVELIQKYVDPQFQGPKTWTTDFEQAMINSIEKTLKDCITYGCLFHFSQAVWRNIQDCGLATLYKNSKKYYLKLNILLALAFLPIDEVCDAFQDLLDENFFFEYPEELSELEKFGLNKLLKYFNKTWIGVKVNENSERIKFQEKFDLSLWNVHQRVLDGQPLTTNDLEAYHTKLNIDFENRKQTNMNNFFRLLKLHHADNAQVMAKKSVTLNKSKPVFVRHSKRLRKHLSTYRETNETRRYRHALEGYNDPHGSNRNDFLRIIARSMRFYRDERKPKKNENVDNESEEKEKEEMETDEIETDEMEMDDEEMEELEKNEMENDELEKEETKKERFENDEVEMGDMEMENLERDENEKGEMKKAKVDSNKTKHLRKRVRKSGNLKKKHLLPKANPPHRTTETDCNKIILKAKRRESSTEAQIKVSSSMKTIYKCSRADCGKEYKVEKWLLNHIRNVHFEIEQTVETKIDDEICEIEPISDLKETSKISRKTSGQSGTKSKRINSNPSLRSRDQTILNKPNEPIVVKPSKKPKCVKSKVAVNVATVAVEDPLAAPDPTYFRKNKEINLNLSPNSNHSNQSKKPEKKKLRSKPKKTKCHCCA